MAEMRATPILKWAGGKQGIANSLIKLFPPRFARYYEPFVGGGSVLFSLQPPDAVIGDANDWLIDTYLAVREKRAQVSELLDDIENTKEEYMRIRQIIPETLSIAQRAAHLIYLNKTCFRGLFRVNRLGQFNVPYGQYNRRYYDPENLRAAADALKSVEIRRGDFELCLQDVTDKDFVYMDPPYHKLGGYSDFNRYTKDKFRENDHFRLAAFCRELDTKGVRWAVSNSNTSFIRRLFAGYHIADVENRREINLDSKKRNITELLITNYTPTTHRTQTSLFESDSLETSASTAHTRL